LQEKYSLNRPGYRDLHDAKVEELTQEKEELVSALLLSSWPALPAATASAASVASPSTITSPYAVL
jgi:hypothetical protein